MMNIIVADENNNSKDLIQTYLREIDCVGNIFFYNDLNSIDCNLDNIDIIIFEINSNNIAENLAIVNEYKNKNKDLNFIAISYEINSELVSRTLSQNVSDFLIKPIIPSILSSSIRKIQSSKEDKPQKKARTICFYSNKGGSGKTSTAVNVAYEIAKQTNEKVCLLDLSFNFGDVATYLDIKPKYTIGSVEKNLENANKDLAYSISEQYRDTSLYVMSFLDDNGLNKKTYNPNLITKLINSLKNIFDYIVIDTQSNVDEASVSIFSFCDLIILIGMLNMVSIRNCQKCLKLFDDIGIDPLRIKLILNRYIENSEISLEDFIEAVGLNIFYKIPNNYLTLIDAVNSGYAVGEVNPNSNIAKSYKNLASEIINVDYTDFQDLKNNNHGIFNLLRRMGE